MAASQERVVVTGGQGFFGAWIVKQLLQQGAVPIVMDIKEDNNIFEQVLEPAEIKGLERHYGDISDLESTKATIVKAQPTAIIHLAGVQIPTCRANPVLGAKVNVIGTINIFEAAKAVKDATGVAPVVVYASSAAVLGPKGDYAETPVPDDYYHKPATIYGVFKICNEGTARIYWQDHRIPSVGLRPLTCFGVGRELGVTSGPTKAIKAAILGRKFVVSMSGTTAFSYIEDVARIFIGCTRAKVEGAPCYNIRGIIDTTEHFLQIVKKVVPEVEGLVTIDGKEVPIMYDVDESALAALLKSVPPPHELQEPFPMPLEECIQRTAAQFRKLKAEHKLHDRDLA